MSTVRPIIFKDYCLVERVSVGGMAEVYRGRSFRAPDAPGFFAIKRILPNLAEDRDFITMFIDEARLAIELNHPNVCQMYELGRIQDSFYIVMEFIAGRDLLAIQKHLRKLRRVMSPAQAAFIVSKICDGLDYAHRKTNAEGQSLSIVHRDISPQNVLVAFDGTVKVIDFGIARAATKTQQTQVGVLKGKFGYMSPEQVDTKELDQRSDVFAVGVLFWELLTARRLFHAESDYEVLDKVRAAKVQPPSERNPAVPPELDRIVLQALKRNRDERYTWASEMARDLRAWLDTVRPPYSQATLSSWMVGAFPEALQSERQKIVDFAIFRTPEDVRRYNAQLDFHGSAPGEGVEVMDLTMASDEATRVFDPEAGAAAEVLAASDGDPSPTMVMDSFASSSSGGPSSSGPSTAPRAIRSGLPLPRPRPARNRALVALASLLVLGIVGLGLWILAPAWAPKAELIVDVTPRQEAILYLDGVQIEGSAPWTLPMRPGPTQVRLVQPDHEPWSEALLLERGQVLRVHPELVPMRGGQATLRLVLDPPDAQVFVNGEHVSGSEAGDRREVALVTGDPSVVEIYAPGHFVEELRLDLMNRVVEERSVELRPAVGTIIVRSQPSGTVFVNGVERGSSGNPLQINDLAFHRPHLLEIRPDSSGHRPFSQLVVFDTVQTLRIYPRLRRIVEPEESADSGVGFLATPGIDAWYRVRVDGRDAGVVTPISEDDALALKPGERVVEFVRGHEVRRVTVEVVPDALVSVELPAVAGDQR